MLFSLVPGDVNEDGSINIIDALNVAQYYVGLHVQTFNPNWADVNCSQTIDITDALLIAQYYVNLISVFPCGPGPSGTPVPPGNPYPDSIFLASPPSLPDPDPDLLYTDPNFLIYSTLLVKEPVLFSGTNFHDTSGYFNVLCRCARENSDYILASPYAEDSPSFIEEWVQVDINSTGFFWIDPGRCSVYRFREEMDDNLMVPGGRDIFYQSKEFIFKGEILDLEEDIPPSENYDKFKVYRARIDVLYLDLWHFAETDIIDINVIGWIPPEKGPLYFWGELNNYLDPEMVRAYISATPRPAWFSLNCGRYEIEILNMVKEETICSSYECLDIFTVLGRITGTGAGRMRTGEVIEFSYTNPPFSTGNKYIFIGHERYTSDWRLRLYQ